MSFPINFLIKSPRKMEEKSRRIFWKKPLYMGRKKVENGSEDQVFFRFKVDRGVKNFLI